MVAEQLINMMEWKMFKFELNQQVWYMYDNKIHSAPIGARRISEVDKEFVKTRAGNGWHNHLQYGTLHGVWYETQLFGSLKELTDYLQMNAVIATPLAKG